MREVVQLTGVPASSIHHYRRLGLVPEPRRVSARRFVYDDRHIEALQLIRSLRGRGCSLEEISDALPELIRSKACDAPVDELVGDRHPQAKLIDAAIEAFAERSVNEVSVTDLCERAEVAKATFYRCFDSKEVLFLAAARAVVERAIDGFAVQAATIDPQLHAATFAGYLRRGLPVLLELAKRLTQEAAPSPTVTEAAELFAGLARRLGRIVNPAGDDIATRQAGGLLIMLAVVTIFQDLMQSELARDATA